MKPTRLWIRVLSLVMILCMTAAVFASCADDKNEGNAPAQNTQAVEETGVPTDEDGFQLDNLPDDLDFNREVQIIHSKHLQRQICADETQAETSVVNAAIYSRWQTVQDRLNVEITWISEPGQWDNSKDTFIKKIETQSTTGAAYDGVICYNLFPGALAHKSLVENLYDDGSRENYIDLTGPWWPSAFVEEAVLNNTVYGLVENSSNATLCNLHGVFFNNQLITDYKLTSPYDMVANDTWTFDNMMAMIKDVGADENNNSKKDFGDFYGLVTGTEAKIETWFFAMGYRYSQKNVEGELELLLKDQATVVEWIDRFNMAFDTRDAWLFDRDENNKGAHTKSFFANKAILYMSSIQLVDAAISKEIDIDYGVVPVPKGSADQERYISNVANHHDTWCIPINTYNFTESTALVECMASESYRQVAPVYFDTCVKLRYAPDERLYEMYDLIRDSITFDFFQTYTFVLDSYALNPRALITKCVTDASGKRVQWGSQWAQYEANINSAFNDILALYE